MLHRPIVFCLALVLHKVHLKQGGFGVGVLTHPKSACLHTQTHTQTAVHTTIFQALNNYHENSLISVRPVSLAVCVSRLISACLNTPVIYFYTS